MTARLLVLLALLAAACAPDTAREAANFACEVERRAVPLPEGLQETSGLAVGRRDPGVLWSHNDSGGDPVLFALSRSGQLVGRVEVTGAENRDWEDVAAGPCPAGRCLFIADVGDNLGRRSDAAIYMVPEPEVGAARTRPAERLPVSYPGGPRDAEALFVLPSGELFVITKGRREPVEVFRYPLPLRPGEAVALQRVAGLSAGARDQVMQVTGADASPGGEWVAVRSYRSLMIFRTEDLVRGRTESPLLADLGPVGEPQGEAVTLDDDGGVLLTSESTAGGEPGTLASLACDLP